MTPRTFRIAGSSLAETVQRSGFAYPPLVVPWAFLAEHEEQALRNHGQTLERLQQRGGITPLEALAILNDRDCNGPDFRNDGRIHEREHAAHQEVARRLAAWEER